jgi:hypothetical protein
MPGILKKKPSALEAFRAYRGMKPPAPKQSVGLPPLTEGLPQVSAPKPPGVRIPKIGGGPGFSSGM